MQHGHAESYLKDETGGRRFWPVRVGQIDLAQLQRDRDQLWAEAFHRYGAGEPWWLDTKYLVEQAAEQQADRYVGDPWLTDVVAHLSTKKSATVSEMLGEERLGIDKGRWGQIEMNRVARILKTLGWKRKQVREGKDREWRYFPPVTGDK
jgi:predicted P-loop ATPase